VVYQDEKQGNFQWAPSPPRVMRAKLEAQRTHAAYAPFARNLTVLGIWVRGRARTRARRRAALSRGAG
jgi:hypothetical protein